MKQLFLDIQARITAYFGTDIAFIHVWNNQLENARNGNDYSFPRPAIFIEFVNDMPVAGVGNNVQVFDPLDVKFHLIHELLDATDGTMEQNLEVFDLKQRLYACFQLWKTTNGSGPFDRVNEEQDYDHDNLYHFIMTFRTTWVDESRPLPLDGVDRDPPFTLDLTANI